jgi:hypothetical protein
VFYRYGNYQHVLNEASLQVSRERLFNDRGQAYALRTRHLIRGELQGASQDDLTTKILALEAAYSVQGGSAGLYQDDGTATAHVLNSPSTVGGVRVVRGPSYPEGARGEYSTWRTYEIELEADFPNAGLGILGWSETLVFSGGGPRFRFLPVINGPPQKQLVNQLTTFHATQEGSAVGRGAYPVPPAPLWPAHEHRDQRSIQYRNPKRTGNTLTSYDVSWRYVFESVTPLAGLPSTG